MQYRADIDGIRTLAIVPVVIEHARLGLSGGFIGVDVFFVLSGFLITTILLRDWETGTASILTFYERRIRRLFPALFLVLVLGTVAATLLFLPEDLIRYAYSAVATLGFGANLWFYRETGYFTEAAELKPLLHMWSLGVEEQFYLFFPLLLWGALRCLNPRAILVGLGVLTLACLYVSQRGLSGNPAAVFYLPHYRAWELAAGSMLALALHLAPGRSLPSGFNALLSVLGAGLILVPMVIYTVETPFPGYSALLPCLGTVLLILTGIGRGSLVAPLLRTGSFVFVGKISYSLYLWHWPVLVFAYYVKAEHLSRFESLVCIGIATLGASLSWHYVERPFRDRAFRPARWAPPRLFMAAGGATALLGFCLLGLVFLDGLPGRMPDRVLAVSSHAALWHDRPECHAVTADRVVAQDLCLRGHASAQPSFILLGDSHADALSPAVFEAAHGLGVSGFQITTPDYLPLPGVERNRPPHGTELTQAVIQFVKENSAIKTIILTAYWEHYLIGQTYRTKGLVLQDDGYEGQGSAYNPIAVRQGLLRFADAMEGVQIVVLDDVPSGNALYLPALQRRLLFYPETQPMLSQAALTAQRALFEPVLTQTAAEHKSVHYYPVLNALCDAGGCPLFAQSGNSIYADGDHLSAYGAGLLADHMVDLLEVYIR